MPGGGAGAHRAPTLRATRVAARRSRVPPHSTELMEVATWIRGRRLGTFEENDAAAWPRGPAAGRSTRPCFAAPSRGANTSVAMSDREPRIIARGARRATVAVAEPSLPGDSGHSPTESIGRVHPRHGVRHGSRG